MYLSTRATRNTLCRETISVRLSWNSKAKVSNIGQLIFVAIFKRIFYRDALPELPTISTLARYRKCGDYDISR